MNARLKEQLKSQRREIYSKEMHAFPHPDYVDYRKCRILPRTASLVSVKCRH